MTTLQVVAFAGSLVLILGIAGAAQLRWLGTGRIKTVLVFLAAAGAILSLAMGGLPPWWFSGSKGAFGLSGVLLLSAFLGGSTEDERTFRKPFFLGLGLTLLAVNVVRMAKSML
ncbi:MAG: hypothetical protein ABI779_28015 [Acidobacteriota bacterium]